MTKEVNLKKTHKAQDTGNNGLQPMMFVIGDSITVFSKIIVFCNDAKYVFHNALDALICCYAIHYVLNLEYQGEVLQVWQLLQLAFFNMDMNEDMKEQVSKRKSRKKSDQATISDQVQVLVSFFQK